MSAGPTDDVDPFGTDLICPVAVAPPDAQLCLGIPCFHGAGARIYKIPHDMSSPPLIPKIIAYDLESGKRFP